MISIIIPTYEMNGKGLEFLTELIQSIDEQKYVQHEIIISDDSANDEIEVFCKGLTNIKYFKHHGEKGAAANLNYGISKASGDIIKPMFQDDRFLTPDCLQKFSSFTAGWAVCTSSHTSSRGDHVPYINTDLYELARGCNTYGAPSAIAFRRTEINFDKTLSWLFDVDFYTRLTLDIGCPEIIDCKVLIREWEGSATNSVANGAIRVHELQLMENKFKNLKNE